MATIKTLNEYPEVSFIGGMSLADLTAKMLEDFTDKYKEVTGKTVVLEPSDTRYLLLKACAYYIYLGYALTDHAGKMNLLKYATGNYLENLGAFKGVERLPAAGSSVIMRFSMKAARTAATAVPAGTRVTSGGSVYFETETYAEIPAGQTYVDVRAVCTTVGVASNSYAVGAINRMVDTVPYIDAVANTTAPTGGRDTESDEDLRERIFLAPENYTTTGSAQAYEYFVRLYDPTIADVKIISPTAGRVKVLPLLADGAIPDSGFLAGLSDFLSRPGIKTLTDDLVVAAPSKTNYNINIKYWINSSDASAAASIQENVAAAVDAYVAWQKSKIGRDLNPDELIYLLRAAGAKRVQITSPVFTTIGDEAVASLASKTVTYGGLEND